MADPLDPKSLDKRTWERYARSGQVDSKAYDKFLKGLPDLADKAVSVRTVMFEDDELDSNAGPGAPEGAA